MIVMYHSVWMVEHVWMKYMTTPVNAQTSGLETTAQVSIMLIKHGYFLSWSRPVSKIEMFDCSVTTDTSVDCNPNIWWLFIK